MNQASSFVSRTDLIMSSKELIDSPEEDERKNVLKCNCASRWTSGEGASTKKGTEWFLGGTGVVFRELVEENEIGLTINKGGKVIKFITF